MSAIAVSYRAVIADLERRRDELTVAIDALRRCCEALGEPITAPPDTAAVCDTHTDCVSEPVPIAETEPTESTAAPSPVTTPTDPAVLIVPGQKRGPSPHGPRQSGTYRPERDADVLCAVTAEPATAADITRRLKGDSTSTKREVSTVWTVLQRLTREQRIVRDGKRMYCLPAVEASKPATPSKPEVSAPKIKTVSASGVALRQPAPAPKFKPGDQPWWTKTPREGMTAAATQRQEEMSASREGRRISSTSGLGAE